MDTQQPGLIHKQIAAVMADVAAIPKDRTNQQQGFKFRGIDDVYAALHDVLSRHGVFTVPTVLASQVEERKSAKGNALIYRVLRMQYRFYTTDGSYIDATVDGEGMDSGDKASNKAMAVAHKYCLLQIFCIPTEESKDPDAEVHQVQPRTAAPARPADSPTKGPKITAAQQKQLAGAWRKAKHPDGNVQAWLLSKYRVSHTKDILVADFAAILKRLSHTDTLDEPAAPPQ